MFKISAKSEKSRARRGVLRAAHGDVQTPVFMPVGTQATVKSLTPRQVEETGAQIILGNTYHLNIRPTSELIARFGGLHEFMKWRKPILTDSGGFQAFSLSKLRKISEDGIEFSSHLDGKKLFLSPESCMRIQNNLGSDIAMVLDECIPYPCEKSACKKSVERTIRWAKRCLDEYKKLGMPERGLHAFGITQGGCYGDIRADCSERLAQLDFPGYAIGGVSVGEPEEQMLEQVDACAQKLPEDKPRYVMGVGTPPQILKMIALGADMFDCVMPTRLARHACAFTLDGEINLKNARFIDDPAPLDEAIDSYASQFSRAYIRHLVKAQEMLACTLLSIHNTRFFQILTRDAREHIESGDFEQWSAAWIERYERGSRK
ncbi:MAG: tRNA guanosine(34) transglycosylase Tgt [Opitutales bacterium]|nr:tRNA guanosine(34) transglycosylase Tgt [Opitutales bacterium]